MDGRNMQGILFSIFASCEQLNEFFMFNKIFG